MLLRFEIIDDSWFKEISTRVDRKSGNESCGYRGHDFWPQTRAGLCRVATRLHINTHASFLQDCHTRGGSGVLEGMLGSKVPSDALPGQPARIWPPTRGLPCRPFAVLFPATVPGSGRSPAFDFVVLNFCRITTASALQPRDNMDSNLC